MNIETRFFSTTNLALAAYLIAGKHLPLERVDVNDPAHAEFVFTDPHDQGQQLEAAFLTTDALVPAATFHRQLRVLRQLIEEKKSAQIRAAERGLNHNRTLNEEIEKYDNKRNSTFWKYSSSRR